MEMKDEIRLEASREVVWEALNNPDILKACIPGCETLDQVSDTEFVSLVVVKVGPIKAKFAGRVTLTDIVPLSRYRLMGEGQGGVAGFAKSDITVELLEEGPTVTVLHYGVSANIGGKIAQLGSRLIDSTARKMADQFFARFTAIVCPSVEEEQTSVPRVDESVDALSGESLVGDLSCGDHIVVTLVEVQEETRVGQAPVASAGGWGQAIARALGVGKHANAPVKPSPSLTPKKAAPKHLAAVVTLNRPRQRNAVSLAMWRDLIRIFDALGQNPRVRAIVLTGAGGNFSAGADIVEFEQVRATVEQGLDYEAAVDACCDAIANTPKPTIAVINGFCMGGACHLAMSCDFRYAQAESRFAIPAARLSVVYGVRGVQRLLALVGVSNAKHIMYSASQFSADEGRRIGFIDHVSPDPMRAARSYAGMIADNAPLTIAGTKLMLNGLTMDLGLLTEEIVTRTVNRAVASQDYRDARQAFVEKRVPVFTGK